MNEEVLNTENTQSQAEQTQTAKNAPVINQEDLWRLKNYAILKDYLDRTISRIAARCVRTGNIAMEEYKYYGYILDVLDEICETGDYLLERDYLEPKIEETIAGGVANLQKRIAEFKVELQNNSSPDMIKTDEDEINAAKALLGIGTFDPTKGAGMSIDDVINKLSTAQEDESEDEQSETLE